MPSPERAGPSPVSRERAEGRGFSYPLRNGVSVHACTQCAVFFSRTVEEVRYGFQNDVFKQKNEEEGRKFEKDISLNEVREKWKPKTCQNCTKNVEDT